MTLSADSFTQACRSGGRQIEAWLRIVEREHGARFYREAAAALRSWQAAEDVVQDAMVKVWQRCATFRGPGDPLAWIHSVVRHTLLDALRQRRPEQPLHDEAGELSPPVAAAVVELSRARVTTPERQLSEQQVEAVFQRGFDRFAQAHPEHATVLRWVVEDGLDNAAVEQLLGRSPGATREFISQCRKKARPFLAEWHALVGAAAGESP
jgi:RNA polymerase sigma-70 factor (ECF subfamily)